MSAVRSMASRRAAVQFDLAGVTFIDDAGKAYLAGMHRLGAEFVAADCLTKAVVAITKTSLADCGCAKHEDETKTQPH